MCSNWNRLDEAILMSINNTIFKINVNIPNLQLWVFFHGAQERVRNSRGKRAISVRANKGLLYITSHERNTIGSAMFITILIKIRIFQVCIQ